ncbi:MAG: hypothetical protein IPN18_21340 [Ignavibacteriales bacterium]|nr:hypothetical protein [Ignavibacteriales bacterium]
MENFACDNGGGNPVAVQWGVENDVSKLLLSFSTLSGGTLYSMQLRNLKSINGVLMTDTVITFTAQGLATGIEGLWEMQRVITFHKIIPIHLIRQLS